MEQNLLSSTPGLCNPLLALSVFIGAGQPLQHGKVIDSNLAWVRPVVMLTATVEFYLAIIYKDEVWHSWMCIIYSVLFEFISTAG